MLNIPVAQARLEPLGIEVFAIERDSDLPFADGLFDLVINRHEAYAERLFVLHQHIETEGALIIHSHRFLIEARKKTTI